MRARPRFSRLPELAEGLRDGAAELDGLVGRDEHVDVRGHPLAVGEPAADEHVEAERAVARPAPATARCR